MEDYSIEATLLPGRGAYQLLFEPVNNAEQEAGHGEPF